MTPELVPSKTLKRAAHAERERLARAMARNDERQTGLRSELEALEAEYRLLEERDRLLQSVGGETVSESSVEGDAAAPAHEILRGAQIREQAARLFYQRHGAGKALHYRSWFELLIESGVEIAGKDPMATLLTNISRSPVVVRGAEAGTYAIDSEAPDRLRKELGEFHAELVDLAGVIARNDEPTPQLLEHRSELLSSIQRHEKLLGEADRVLGPSGHPGLAQAA